MSMTEKELAELATQRSLKALGRISPAYIDGYMKGYRDEEAIHQPVEIPLKEE